MTSSFREHMDAGRRQLHAEMSVPALYFTWPYVEGTTPTQEISVRVWHGFALSGDLKGTNFNYAEVEADSPRIIFLRSEIRPFKRFVVSVAPGEAYRIDTVEPPNGITVTAKVKRLGSDEAQGLPVPGVVRANLQLSFPAFGISAEIEL